MIMSYSSYISSELKFFLPFFSLSFTHTLTRPWQLVFILSQHLGIDPSRIPCIRILPYGIWCWGVLHGYLVLRCSARVFGVEVFCTGILAIFFCIFTVNSLLIYVIPSSSLLLLSDLHSIILHHPTALYCCTDLPFPVPLQCLHQFYDPSFLILWLLEIIVLLSFISTFVTRGCHSLCSYCSQ